MKILKQEKSELLPRIEIEAMETHIAKRTPSTLEIKESLSKSLKVDKDLILVKHIYSLYGVGGSKIIAYVYDRKEDMERIIKKGKKQKEAEKKAAEEAKKAAEAPKEEPKVVEVKEEPKVEEVENGKETKKEQSSE